MGQNKRETITLASHMGTTSMGSEDSSSQYFTPLSGHPSRFTATTFSDTMCVTGDITSDSISSMPLISSMTDSELSSLCSTPNTPQDEAIKLLASHGITMLPEDPPISPQSLSLTDAGKLALSLTSKPTSLPTTTLPRLSPNPRSISLSVPKSFSHPSPPQPKVTKIVTLNSSSKKAASVSPKPQATPITFPKPPRVIKLTAEQFAAIKKGRAGQIVLPAMGQNKRETITLASHMGTTSKREGEVVPHTSVSISPPKKIIRLETPGPSYKQNISETLNNMDDEKLELQKQLQRQLEMKEQEAEKLKEELRRGSRKL